LRVLLEPVPLRQALTSHVVSTTYELGWSSLKNGDLIKAANIEFDILVTTDQNLRYQQNLANLKLAILVLPFASWPKIQDCLEKIVAAVNSLRPGDYVEFTLG